MKCESLECAPTDHAKTRLVYKYGENVLLFVRMFTILSTVKIIGPSYCTSSGSRMLLSFYRVTPTKSSLIFPYIANTFVLAGVSQGVTSMVIT